MADRIPAPDLLPRHATRERLLHWLVAVAFVFAAASGLALFHPALFFLTNLLGGGPWSALLHPFVGLAMALAFGLFALPLWELNRLTAGDRIWLDRLRDVVDNRDERLPEAGKYNAGQKVLYIATVACVALLLLSGLLLWRRYFSGFFAVGVVRFAAVVHALAAFVLVFATIVHVAAAVWVKGSIRAMTLGTVTLGWAYKHHRAWFREMTRPSSGR